MPCIRYYLVACTVNPVQRYGSLRAGEYVVQRKRRRVFRWKIIVPSFAPAPLRFWSTPDSTRLTRRRHSLAGVSTNNSASHYLSPTTLSFSLCLKETMPSPSRGIPTPRHNHSPAQIPAYCHIQLQSFESLLGFFLKFVVKKLLARSLSLLSGKANFYKRWLCNLLAVCVE